MRDSIASETQPYWMPDLVRCAQLSDVDLVVQSDPRYENARLLFNRFHDLYPAALVRTCGATSVSKIIRFAKDYGVPLAIRGGGHHIAGFGSCEGGIVIDFSPFRKVFINSTTRIIEVEPGAQLGDVDRALCPNGIVLPTGTVSETGIAGLTLGGGIGWLVGFYGLTCDHLVGADVVLADGQRVRAEDSEHRDLLWALRGGGGNFGVVTRFRYRSLPLPLCTAGSATIDFDNAALALERCIDFLCNSCPRNLTVAPAFTWSTNGRRILSVDFCLVGEDDNALRSLSRAVGSAHWSIQRNVDYIAWQSSFDALFQTPMRGYWKARYSKQLTKSDIDILISAFESTQIDQSAILVEHLHGAFLDTGIDTSAFPLRSSRFGVLVSARWTDPSQDQTAISWVRKTLAHLDPLNTSAVYSNYAMNDDLRVLSTFKNEMALRLEKVKQFYDPLNVFCRNHNFRFTPSMT